jgi:hypothetical protein
MSNMALKQAIAIAILASASTTSNAMMRVIDAGPSGGGIDPALGTISATASTGFADKVLGGGQSFSDIFTFNFSGANVGTHFHVVDVPTTVGPQVNFDSILTGVSLFSAGANGVIGGNDDTLLAISSSPGTDSIDLAYNAAITGPAYFTVDGVANGSSGAIFAGSIAPIPEPETYAMLLAGLGLMGAVVRRRARRES